MNHSHIYGAPTLLVLVLTLLGCGNVVYLSGGSYPELPDSAAVDIIDATGLSRSQVEKVLSESEVLARFHNLAPQRDQNGALEASELEKAKKKARSLGADVVMFIQDSEMVATIKQDVRFAGPSDPTAIVFYAMKKRN